MGYRDEELSEEELKEVTAGIVNKKTDETLDRLSKAELTQLKEVVERELSLEEMDNIKAGIPREMIDEMKEQNSNIFRNK